MSIWGERARSLFGGGPKYVPLPRAVVSAALQETAQHPGSFGGQIPQLRRALAAHQQAWSVFHERQIAWMLRHSDFVGGLLSDPDARASWIVWGDRIEKAVSDLTEVEKEKCSTMGRTARRAWCTLVDDWIAGNQTRVETIQRSYGAWQNVLTMRPITALDWWRDTQEASHPVILSMAALQKKMNLLYNITHPLDLRVREIMLEIQRVSEGIHRVTPWIQLIVRGLLEGELWTACLEHVRQREFRVRELMASTGIQELFNAHERGLNASLRIVGADTPAAKLVNEWFTEMMGYAWWIGDDMPSIVRRCVGQETGDCMRIGPSEIAALTAQMDRAAAIVTDSVRRIFIGMWNALPALSVLFVVELIMLLCGVRVIAQPQPPPLLLPPVPPQGPILFHLENTTPKRKKRPTRQLFLTHE
jgi:hypothetical protein